MGLRRVTFTLYTQSGWSPAVPPTGPQRGTDLLATPGHPKGDNSLSER